MGQLTPADGGGLMGRGIDGFISHSIPQTLPSNFAFSRATSSRNNLFSSFKSAKRMVLSYLFLHISEQNLAATRVG